jgi:hypothetical protein
LCYLETRGDHGRRRWGGSERRNVGLAFGAKGEANELAQRERSISR